MPGGQQAALPGSGAAEFNTPRGVAGNSENGHVYIADSENARVDEYTAWGYFVKAWGWGVANGGNELQTCGPAEPEIAPPPSLCRQGIAGSGKGQMRSVEGGMAVDGAGDVWVGDLQNRRIQKFTPAGEFLLMFGGEVNRTKVEASAPAPEQNVCPIDPSDVCQAGSAGAGPSYLEGTFVHTPTDAIAYSPTANAIVVGDKDRIQIFNLDGSFKEEIAFEGPLAPFAGKTVNGLDVDSEGNIYFSLDEEEDLYKVSAAGEPLNPGKPLSSKFEMANPLGVAVDVNEDVFGLDGRLGTGKPAVVEFDAAGTKIVPSKEEEEEEEEEGQEANGKLFPYIAFKDPELAGLATNFCAGSKAPGDLYISFVRPFNGEPASYVNAYGTGPVGCEPPPPLPPEIVAQYATAVGRDDASVRAEINPRFFTDATYYVEYGSGRCSEGGCDHLQPLPPGTLLTGEAVGAPIRTAGVSLTGLAPGTTYHYRFVAQSSGGGPVYGIDPDGGGPRGASAADGEEGTFTTFRAAGAQEPCPANEAFRAGPSGKLPDCRGYELVSPLDKGDGDVALWAAKQGIEPRLFELDQSARSGDRFAFSSTATFAAGEASPFVSEYLADRAGGGWSSRGISAPRTEPILAADGLAAEFDGFSDDLCQAWFRHNSPATLSEDAIGRYPNLYRRESCSGTPSYEALTTVEPPQRTPHEYFELRVQGALEDGTRAIFVANDKLAPDAPELKENELLLYEHTPAGLRFVCYLPSGSPSPRACAAGTGAGSFGGEQSSVHNAISADGSRIFWTAYSGNLRFGDNPGVPGQIYVRIDGNETRKVSGTVSSEPAWYWTASEDGSKAIFEFAKGTARAGELYEVDVDTGTPRLIAKGVEGPLGASEDASRIYLASSEDLDGEGPAANGAHNLYRYEAEEGGPGSFAFIMALSAADIGGSLRVPAPIDEVPAQRSARVSPDGLNAAFVSSASPTPSGFDNLDAASGEPDQEVYLYDASRHQLLCASCSPTGARPAGEDISTELTTLWAAARIQGWEALMHAPRVLSEDGSRLFFESHEALVPRDTNGTWDVYEWEAPGAGSCSQASETFSSVTEGCVDLISAGDSPAVSTFLDADPSGANVFIGTQSSLVGADYGLNDVYDARIDGGFPEPERASECEGEACQSPPPPPAEVTPASEAFEGKGNPHARRCRKGMRKVRRHGKVRCAKKHKHKHKRGHHSKRRASR